MHTAKTSAAARPPLLFRRDAAPLPAPCVADLRGAPPLPPQSIIASRRAISVMAQYCVRIDDHNGAPRLHASVVINLAVPRHVYQPPQPGVQPDDGDGVPLCFGLRSDVGSFRGQELTGGPPPGGLSRAQCLCLAGVASSASGR